MMSSNHTLVKRDMFCNDEVRERIPLPNDPALPHLNSTEWSFVLSKGRSVVFTYHSISPKAQHVHAEQLNFSATSKIEMGVFTQLR